MKQIRRRLTYANVMSSIAVFLVVAGGSAFAAGKLGRNTVGTKQLKNNAVTAGKIKKEAVGGAKIKKGSITSTQVKAGSLTGASINLSTLGKVPSAAAADNATNATNAANAIKADSATNATNWSRYYTSGVKKASVGQTVTLGSIGPFTITGKCVNLGGGEYEATTYIRTSQDGAFVNTPGGTSYYEADFNTGIEDEIGEEASSASAYWYDYYDDDETGWTAASPDGSVVLVANSSQGVHVFGADCAFVTSWTARS